MNAWCLLFRTAIECLVAIRAPKLVEAIFWKSSVNYLDFKITCHCRDVFWLL